MRVSFGDNQHHSAFPRPCITLLASLRNCRIANSSSSGSRRECRRQMNWSDSAIRRHSSFGANFPRSLGSRPTRLIRLSLAADVATVGDAIGNVAAAVTTGNDLSYCRPIYLVVMQLKQLPITRRLLGYI